jgi:hypothetical protein
MRPPKKERPFDREKFAKLMHYIIWKAGENGINERVLPIEIKLQILDLAVRSAALRPYLLASRPLCLQEKWKSGSKNSPRQAK